MTINGKKITIWSAAALVPLIMLYFFMSDRGSFPLTEAAHDEDIVMMEEAHADDLKDRDCRIARIEWSMANENLRYANTDLKRDEENVNIQRAVENYTFDRDEAQERITLNCN